MKQNQATQNYAIYRYTNAAERVLGVQISNREAQRKPFDQIRLLLFLDVPPLAYKEQSKETTG